MYVSPFWRLGMDSYIRATADLMYGKNWLSLPQRWGPVTMCPPMAEGRREKGQTQ